MSWRYDWPAFTLYVAPQTVYFLHILGTLVVCFSQNYTKGKLVPNKDGLLTKSYTEGWHCKVRLMQYLSDKYDTIWHA